MRAMLLRIVGGGGPWEGRANDMGRYDDRPGGQERERSSGDDRSWDGGERSSRERDDQQRWATDRDNFGGGGGSRGGMGRGGDSDRGMHSGGWDRDDRGFREPGFVAGGDDRSRGYGGSDGGSQNYGGQQYGGGQQHGGPSRSFGYGGDQQRQTYGGASSGAMPSGTHRGKGPKNYARSDERILEDVCQLLEDADVDASNIEVNVSNGEVTLTGTVDDRRAKREAEDVACEARGVKDCHNQLRVDASGQAGARGPSSTDKTASGGRNGSTATGDTSSTRSAETRSRA